MKSLNAWLRPIATTFALFMSLSGMAWGAIPVTVNRNIHLSWTDSAATDSTMVITWMEKHGRQTGVEFWEWKSSEVEKQYVAATAIKSDMLKRAHTDHGRWVHSAELVDLKDNTEYGYRVGWEIGNEKSWSEPNSFKTGPPKISNEGERASFRFVVGGDAQSTTYRSRRNELAYWIMREEPQPGFLFFAGDELSGTDPGRFLGKQWQKFFNVASEEPVGPVGSDKESNSWRKLLAGTPYMTCDSNHVDTHRSFFDLFRYPKPFGEKKWDKPIRNYNEEYAPYSMGHKGWYSFNYGNAHFIVLQITTYAGTQVSFKTSLVPKEDPENNQANEQYGWLEDDLKAADADPDIKWKFAIWHAPAYSSKGRIIKRHKEIQETVCRLLTRYNVDMVFNGHQHRYERSKMIYNDETTTDGDGAITDQNDYSTYDATKKGVVYVVSGGAGVVSDGTVNKRINYSVPSNRVPPHWWESLDMPIKANHYCVVDIDNSKGELRCSVWGYRITKELPVEHTVFNEEPDLLDSFTIEKKPDPSTLTVISSTEPVTIDAGKDETRVGLKDEAAMACAVSPNHAFALINSSNSDAGSFADASGVYQVSAQISDDGKELILKRGTADPSVASHVTSAGVESPYIRVQHGSEKLGFGEYSKNVLISNVLRTKPLSRFPAGLMHPDLIITPPRWVENCSRMAPARR